MKIPATLEDYVSDDREILNGEVHWGVFNLKVAKLIIWKVVPIDKPQVKQLIEKLKHCHKEDDAENVVFFVSEAEAYEVLFTSLEGANLPNSLSLK